MQWGGIKSIPCNEMATMIWDWCRNHNIWLSATRIQGSNNIQADKESRVLKESTEWSLSQGVFNAIQERWGMFDIDLFASRLNFKVPEYVSWRPDPGAQLEQDQSTGILIVPMWTTQAWFTLLLNLLTDSPLVLPQTDSLLSLPHSNAVHPLSRQLQLMACKVSGSPSSRELFQAKLPTPVLVNWYPKTICPIYQEMA